MQIAIIGPTYPFKGGIAHHTTLLVNALRQAGHDVLFISYTRQYPRFLYGRSDKDPSAQPIQAEVEVHYVIDSLNPISWIRAGRMIATFGAEQLILPWWVPFWSPLYLVLTHYLTRAKPGLPVVFLCHNVLPHESSRLKRWITTLTLGQGSGYLVQSQSEAEKLSLLLNAPRYVVVPHPSYAPLVSQEGGQQTTGLPNEMSHFIQATHRALFCGIVRHYKGLDILLEAIRIAKERLPEGFHLAIAGEFWEDVSYTQRFIKSHQLESMVTIDNRYIPNQTLAAYLTLTDIVVLPYRSATQSGIIQAALAAHRPVIGSRVGGIVDAITPEVNGILIEPENPAELANTLVSFFETDPTHWRFDHGSGDADMEWQAFATQLLSVVGQD